MFRIEAQLPGRQPLARDTSAEASHEPFLDREDETLKAPGLSGRRWRTRVPHCWPPSAAQTVHADFPHTAFTKTQISEGPKKELIELAD